MERSSDSTIEQEVDVGIDVGVATDTTTTTTSASSPLVSNENKRLCDLNDESQEEIMNKTRWKWRSQNEAMLADQNEKTETHTRSQNHYMRLFMQQIPGMTFKTTRTLQTKHWHGKTTQSWSPKNLEHPRRFKSSQRLGDSYPNNAQTRTECACSTTKRHRLGHEVETWQENEIWSAVSYSFIFKRTTVRHINKEKSLARGNPIEKPHWNSRKQAQRAAS